MRKASLVLLLFLIVICFTDGAYALEASQIHNQVEAIRKAPAKKFLRKDFDQRTFQVVFAHNKMRYIMEYEWLSNGIMIWFRPNGTHSQHALAVFTDIDLDGVVDHGWNIAKFYVSTNYNGISTAINPEQQLYWQKEYENFATVLQEFLGQ